MTWNKLKTWVQRIWQSVSSYSPASGRQPDRLPDTGQPDSFYYDIPIFINNRDLVVWPGLMVDKLLDLGYHNLIILDNDSSYPPLLEYYDRVAVKVVRLGKNYGLRALFECGILSEPTYKNQMYVYSDPDCLLADFCPPDFLRRFHQILLKHPEIPKVGFSLCAWDWAYSFWEVEKGYFSERVGDYAYRAPIDTTFALYRAGVETYCIGGFRTTRPYQCRHIPWEHFIHPLGESPEDFIYYLLRADPQSSVAFMSQQDSGFLQHPRVRAVKAKFGLDG